MFFSVKHAIKIGDKIYSPCICYAVTKELSLTVNKLKADGKAKVYEKEVFFQNGKELASLAQRKAEEKEEKVEAKTEAKVEAKTEENKKGF